MQDSRPRQDEPGHFSPTGNPKHDVLKREMGLLADLGALTNEDQTPGFSETHQNLRYVGSTHHSSSCVCVCVCGTGVGGGGWGGAT